MAGYHIITFDDINCPAIKLKLELKFYDSGLSEDNQITAVKHLGLGEFTVGSDNENEPVIMPSNFDFEIFFQRDISDSSFVDYFVKFSTLPNDVRLYRWNEVDGIWVLMFQGELQKDYISANHFSRVMRFTTAPRIDLLRSKKCTDFIDNHNLGFVGFNFCISQMFEDVGIVLDDVKWDYSYRGHWTYDAFTYNDLKYCLISKYDLFGVMTDTISSYYDALKVMLNTINCVGYFNLQNQFVIIPRKAALGALAPPIYNINPVSQDIEFEVVPKSSGLRVNRVTGAEVDFGSYFEKNNWLGDSTSMEEQYYFTDCADEGGASNRIWSHTHPTENDPNPSPIKWVTKDADHICVKLYELSSTEAWNRLNRDRLKCVIDAIGIGYEYGYRYMIGKPSCAKIFRATELRYRFHENQVKVTLIEE